MSARDRAERLEPVLARRGSRIVKLTGDGALIEFGSAVEALSAAIEFQQAMVETEAERSEAERLVFRVGAHLGDVIVDGDDICEDGVNVAARLEAEAIAGGIMVSGDMHNAASGRLKATFEDRGGMALKNIERPVQAYAVRWATGPSACGPRRQSGWRRQRCDRQRHLYRFPTSPPSRCCRSRTCRAIRSRSTSQTG